MPASPPNRSRSGSGLCGSHRLDAVLGALVVAGVLALVERVRLWYLVVAGAIVGGALVSVALAPVVPFGMAVKTTPNALVALAAPLAQRIGAPGTPIVLLASARHSNALVARAAGIGSTSRALIGDVVLDHMTPPEQRVVLAHTLAHVRFGDPLRQTLLAVALFVLSAAIACCSATASGSDATTTRSRAWRWSRPSSAWCSS